ncbi:MAG: GspH/FimT family pseudopilin [Betaproteobacteria bacterium]
MPPTPLKPRLTTRQMKTAHLRNSCATFITGFSLTEMMVTLTIISLLLGLAIPSYQAFAASSYISSEVSELNSDIELARREALKLGQTVIVCPSKNAIDCTDQASWANGWIVFTTENDCSSTNGTLLRIKHAFASSTTANYIPFEIGHSALCFSHLGVSSADNAGLFIFNTPPAKDKYKRCLTVSDTGPAQVMQKGQSDIYGTTCS